MSYVVSYMNDFCGGERDATAPDTLEFNEVLLCENLDPDISGGLNQRFGTVTFKTSITGKRKDRIIEWDYLSGATRYIKRLELIDGKIIDPDTPDAGKTYKVLYTGTITSLDVEPFGSKLYILTGADYLVYDGTAITSVTQAATDDLLDDIKKCRYLTRHRDRMFFAGNTDAPNNLYYSQRLDPTYVKNSTDNTTINPIQALTDDSDGVTCLKTYADALIVFKKKAIFAWTGVDPLSDVKFQKLNSHTGTIAHRSVVPVDNYLFFLGFDKQVYMLHTADTGLVSVMQISTKKEKGLSAITQPDLPHQSTVSAIYWEGKYLLSASTNGDRLLNDTIFVFHTTVWKKRGFVECWTRYKGLAVTDFTTTVAGELLLANTTGGLTLKADKTAYTDRGATILCYLKPRSFDGSDKGKEYALYQKKFKMGAVFARQFDLEETRMKHHHKVDYVGEDEEAIDLHFDESGIWDYSDWDKAVFGINDASYQPFTIGKKGLKLDMELYVVDLSADPTIVNRVCIYGIGVKYKIKKMR